MDTWVIPDIHGCLQTVRSLVERMIIPSPGDRLIFLGDYIDRGPKSREVIDYVMQLQQSNLEVVALRGNHEDYLLRVLETFREKTLRMKLGLKSGLHKEWLYHGGRQAMQSFGVQSPEHIPELYIEWMNNLGYYFEYRNYLVVHAGFNFSGDDLFADTRSMMWIRDYEVDRQKLEGRTIIHGHVPVSLEFIFHALEKEDYGFIDLDNGVYMPDRPGYGNLLALELNSRKLLVQPNIES